MLKKGKRPDLSIIKEDKIIKLFEKNVGQIIQMKGHLLDEFKESFGYIENDEIDEYVNWFSFLYTTQFSIHH